MTAKEALFEAMGWTEDAKDAPGQGFFPGFEPEKPKKPDVSSWKQKGKGKSGGYGIPIAGVTGVSSPSGTPQSELETHDKKNHPDGYKGGRCKLRARLAASGFDVRGYDARVHNFTAEEGYDYNSEHKESKENEKEEEGSQDNVLPKPEKVDIGGTEVQADTEAGKKTADVLAELQENPEKAIAEHKEAFGNVNPEEVKEKLPEAIKKLGENPATNGTAPTKEDAKSQAEAQKAQHERDIKAGQELNAEVSSEAGRLDLLIKNHDQAVADIAKQIEAMNGNEPETTALKNALVDENKKFDKEFQKIDPVAQNEDGTPESPDDHAKHCKANPKSNCPFLKKSMTPEQLSKVDSQGEAEATSEGEGGIVPAKGEVTQAGEGTEKDQGTAGEEGGHQSGTINWQTPVTDEEYEAIKGFGGWQKTKEELKKYVSQGGEFDLRDTERIPVGSILERTFNEVVAELKAEGQNVEEWNEDDVIDITEEETPVEGEESDDQKKIVDKKGKFQNLGDNPLGEEGGGKETGTESDADDLDFIDSDESEKGTETPKEGTNETGKEQPEGKGAGIRKPLDDGRRPGLKTKSDWTPSQKAALQELAKRFGEAAEGFLSGVNDDKFFSLLHNISHFTDVRRKWSSTPNVSDHRDQIREGMTREMDKHVDKSQTDILYEQLQAIINDKSVSTLAKASLEHLIPWLQNKDMTNLTKQKILKEIGSVIREFGLGDRLREGGENVGDKDRTRYSPENLRIFNEKYTGKLAGSDLLNPPSSQEESNSELAETADILSKVMASENLNMPLGELKSTKMGPSQGVLTFEVPVGFDITKANKSATLQKLGLAIGGTVNSIEQGAEPNTINITYSSQNPRTVNLADVVSSKEWKDNASKMAIPNAVGIDAEGNSVVKDAAKGPHEVVTGATGTGKSVYLQNKILAPKLVKTPNEWKHVLIDPKQQEFTGETKSPYNWCPVQFSAKGAATALARLVQEMKDRASTLGINLDDYDEMTGEGPSQDDTSKNLQSYNEKNKGKELPFISLVIDEVQDLIQDKEFGKDITQNLAKLLSKARSVGINVTVATQSDRVENLPGILRTNLPTKTEFPAAASDTKGSSASKSLKNAGDFIQTDKQGKKITGRACLVQDDEIKRVNDFYQKQVGETINNTVQEEGSTSPSQTPDQIIDGLAKTDQGKAGLKKIADRLAQGNMKPIKVGEKVADMTKKLLDGMGFGYTEMKGADGKVIITPKPKEQAPESQTSGTEINKQGATEESPIQYSDEKTKGSNASESGAGGTLESGGEGGSISENTNTEQTPLEKQKTTEQGSLNAKAQKEYGINHDAFDEAVKNARETYEKEKAKAKTKKDEKTAYDKMNETINMEMASLNVWRSKNGLKPITDVNDDGSYQIQQETNTETPQGGASSPETSESASGETVGSEEQGTEPAKEGSESPEQLEDQWGSYESQYEQTREGQMKRLNDERDAARKQLANELIKKGVDPKLIRNDKRWKAQEKEFANEEARINEQYPEQVVEEPQEQTEESSGQGTQGITEPRFDTSKLSEDEKFEFETELAHHDDKIKDLKDKYRAGEIDRKEYRKQMAAENKSFEGLKKEFGIEETPKTEPKAGEPAAGTAGTVTPEQTEVQQNINPNPVKEESDTVEKNKVKGTESSEGGASQKNPPPPPPSSPNGTSGKSDGEGPINSGVPSGRNGSVPDSQGGAAAITPEDIETSETGNQNQEGGEKNKETASVESGKSHNKYKDISLKDLYDHDDKYGTDEEIKGIEKEIKDRLDTLKKSEIYEAFKEKSGNNHEKRIDAVRRWTQQQLQNGISPDKLLNFFDANILQGLGELGVVRPSDVMASYDAVSEEIKNFKKNISSNPQPKKPAPKVEPPASETKDPADEEISRQVADNPQIKNLENQLKKAKTAKEKASIRRNLNRTRKELENAIRNAASENSGVEEVTPGTPKVQTTETPAPVAETTPAEKPVSEMTDDEIKSAIDKIGNDKTIKASERKKALKQFNDELKRRQESNAGTPAVPEPPKDTESTETAEPEVSPYITAAIEKAGLNPESAKEIKENNGIQAALKNLEDAKEKHGEDSEAFKKAERNLRGQLTRMANAIRNRDDKKDVVNEQTGTEEQSTDTSGSQETSTPATQTATSSQVEETTTQKEQPKAEGAPELLKAIEDDEQVKDFREQAEQAKEMFGENSSEHKQALDRLKKVERDAKINKAAEAYEEKLHPENLKEGERKHTLQTSVRMANEILTDIERRDAEALKSKVATYAQLKAGGKIHFPEDGGSRSAFEMLTGLKLPVPDKSLGDFKKTNEKDPDTQGYVKRVKKFIDDFCKTRPSTPNPKPQATNTNKPVVTENKPKGKVETSGSNTKIDSSKKDITEVKGTKEPHTTENPFDKKSAISGGTHADLSSQGAESRSKAMEKADTSKSKGMKILSELSAPKKITRESAKEINAKLAAVANEIKELEHTLNEGGEKLSNEDRIQATGLIGHLQQGLKDIYMKGKLGKGNFTFSPQKRDGDITGLTIKTFKGENGEMQDIGEPPKTKFSEMSNEAKVSAVRKIIEEETRHSPSRGNSAQISEEARKLVSAVTEKNADSLKDILRISNPASRKAFEAMTGEELPNTIKGTLEAIDKHCGITPEQREEKNKQRDQERKEAENKDASEKAKKEAVEKAAEAKKIKDEDEAFKNTIKSKIKFYDTDSKRRSLSKLMKEGYRFSREPDGKFGFWDKDGNGYYLTDEMIEGIEDVDKFINGAIRYGQNLDNGTITHDEAFWGIDDEPDNSTVWDEIFDAAMYSMRGV